IWNEAPIKIQLKLLSPWWQTLTFKIIVFVLIFCSIFVFFYYRLYRIKKVKQMLELQVEQKTRDLNLSYSQTADERDRFANVMDSLEQIIYVADMTTYELLFINKKVREMMGNVDGQICWQAIQKNQKGPCTFCTNHLLIDSNGEPSHIHT
ncbi:diguanylate cyclase, partial [Candidatus Magnetomorum sp. HK-1]